MFSGDYIITWNTEYIVVGKNIRDAKQCRVIEMSGEMPRVGRRSLMLKVDGSLCIYSFEGETTNTIAVPFNNHVLAYGFFDNDRVWFTVRIGNTSAHRLYMCSPKGVITSERHGWYGPHRVESSPWSPILYERINREYLGANDLPISRRARHDMDGFVGWLIGTTHIYSDETTLVTDDLLDKDPWLSCRHHPSAQLFAVAGTSKIFIMHDHSRVPIELLVYRVVVHGERVRMPTESGHVSPLLSAKTPHLLCRIPIECELDWSNDRSVYYASVDSKGDLWIRVKGGLQCILRGL